MSVRCPSSTLQLLLPPGNPVMRQRSGPSLESCPTCVTIISLWLSGCQGFLPTLVSTSPRNTHFGRLSFVWVYSVARVLNWVWCPCRTIHDSPVKRVLYCAFISRRGVTVPIDELQMVRDMSRIIPRNHLIWAVATIIIIYGLRLHCRRHWSLLVRILTPCERCGIEHDQTSILYVS
jgi:hypothetical protein